MGSYGQDLAREFIEAITSHRCVYDHRPSWLLGLEIDLWFPSLNLAVEFQGDQHYVPAFGEESYRRQCYNDAKKRRLCELNGVYLMRIDAIDLQLCVLKCKLKLFRRRMSQAGRHVAWLKSTIPRDEWRRLSIRAVQYRATLRSTTAGVTAHKRGSDARRMKAYEAHRQANPFINHTPPSTKDARNSKRAQLREAADRFFSDAIQREHRPGDVMLTKEMLESLRTMRGGYSYATLRALSLPIPPYRGWLKRLRGVSISAASLKAAQDGRRGVWTTTTPNR